MAVDYSNLSTKEIIEASGATDVAFRRAGTVITDAVTVNEGINQIHADFNVSKQPIIKVNDDILDAIRNGQPITHLIDLNRDLIKPFVATVRDDTNATLGVVSPSYGIVQNERAFEFINFIKEVTGEQPMLETAGLLKDGARIFVTAKLGSDMFIGGEGDKIENYVVFTNTHDGTGAVMAFFTPVRVVCQNTLNIAIRGCKNKLTFRHTASVNERISAIMEQDRKKALEVFNANHTFSQKFVEAMLGLKAQTVTNNDVLDFAARINLTDEQYKLYLQSGRKINFVEDISTRAKNRVDALLSCIDKGIGQQQHRGTKLWLLNGLTSFIHNETKYKSAEDEFLTINEGLAAKKVQYAYDLLTA